MTLTLEILKERVKPWINTLCITDYRFEVARLVDGIDGDDDFYYVFDTPRGIEYQSCVGGFIPLKGKIDNDKYERMVRIWNLNNIVHAI